MHIMIVHCVFAISEIAGVTENIGGSFGNRNLPVAEVTSHQIKKMMVTCIIALIVRRFSEHLAHHVPPAADRGEPA